MSVQAHYVLRSPLLCVDRATRAFVLLEPGSLMTYLSPENERMVTVAFDGREILAFAADFEDRAEAACWAEA